MTFTHGLSTNNYGPAKFIVDASAANGTHTTIATALTSSASGDTIFIRPGTYTENLTLKAGVNLVGFTGDDLTPNVTITGKATFTAAGTVSICNIRLTTNSDFVLVVSGSSASIVNLKNCYFNFSNNTGISFTTSSSSAQINVFNSQGDLGTTGIALWSDSSAGTFSVAYSIFTNSGGSTTSSTHSAGIAGYQWSKIKSPITTSSTNGFASEFTDYNTLAQNTTALTIGGSGSNTIVAGYVVSGTASALSVSQTITVAGLIVDSTNTNAITGAGTINYDGLSFNNTSKTINTTTQSALNGTTFSPTLQFGGGTTGITYTTRYGKFIRFDNVVFFSIYINLSSKGSSTGSATIASLPFTSANDTGNYNYPTDFIAGGVAALQVGWSNLAAAASTLSLFQEIAGTATALTDANFNNTTIVRTQGFYFI